MLSNKDWSRARKPKLEGVTACILAGGLGTRLRSVLPDTPKAMAPIDGAPFLNHVLEKLALAGISRTVLCTGHLAGQIQGGVGDNFHDMEMVYSQEDKPMGTGGAVRLALPHLHASLVLVLNGDSYCDVDINELHAWHTAKQARGSLVLAKVNDCSRYGSVTQGAEGAVTSFLEKGKQTGGGWINAGVYLLDRSLIEAIPEGREVSMERDVIPGIIGKSLFGYRMEDGGFIDIGTPESYAEAKAFFAQRSRA